MNLPLNCTASASKLKLLDRQKTTDFSQTSPIHGKSHARSIRATAVVFNDDYLILVANTLSISVANAIIFSSSGQYS